MKDIVIGSEYTANATVSSNMLACAVGSGDIEVYATPMMMALMEQAAMLCLRQFLDEGETSVGTSIAASHCAATPAGMDVSATAVVTSANGREVSFQLTAKDGSGVIGEGTHTRFVVNAERFAAKVKAKLGKV